VKPNEVIFYLIGQITADVETYNWRKRIRERFNEHEKIKFYDPCSNTFSKSILKQSKGTVDGFKKVVRLNGNAGILPVRDASFVFSSDGAIANLNIYTKEKPLIGTFFELAWYRMCPDKTVIGIYDGVPQKAFQCYHPFVWNAVHTWVRNEEEAGDVLMDFFG
jgi:hypothetical protein